MTMMNWYEDGKKYGMEISIDRAKETDDMFVYIKDDDGEVRIPYDIFKNMTYYFAKEHYEMCAQDIGGYPDCELIRTSGTTYLDTSIKSACAVKDALSTLDVDDKNDTIRYSVDPCDGSISITFDKKLVGKSTNVLDLMPRPNIRVNWAKMPDGTVITFDKETQRPKEVTLPDGRVITPDEYRAILTEKGE